MNKLVSKNPVQRFKEGRKIVKAERGVKSFFKSVVNNWDKPVQVQQTPGTATSYASFGQYMPKSESTIGDQANLLLQTVTAPITVSAGSRLLSIGKGSVAKKALPGMQRALTGRVVTPNTPAIATPNYPSVVNNGLTLGQKVARGIGGSFLFGYPIANTVLSGDSDTVETAGINSQQTKQNNPQTTENKKEYIPLGQVAAKKEKFLGKQNNTQYNEIIPGIINGVNDIDTQMKINSLPSSNKEINTSSPIFYGTRAGGKVNKNALSNITDDQKTKLIGTGKFTEADFANTKSLQTALNNYFFNDAGAGSIKVDNLWGNQTQKAFDLALSKASSPIATTIKGIETQNPISIAPQINIQKMSQEPIKVATQPVTKTYNRSEIRDFIRRQGKGAYDFTGAQRRALRMVMNGQGTDEDKAVVKAMGLFKQGGQLVFRDPVKRFKLRIKK